MIYIGIDNGISGGVAVISAHDGAFIEAFPMPIQRGRKGNEIDVRALWNHLEPIREHCVAILEEPGGSKSAAAASSMGGSFHAIRAVLELKRIRFHRVTPQEWHKVMLPGCEKGKTKPYALAVARSLWPDETWLKTERCRVPHDGMVDAALIAEYGRRKAL